MDAYSDERFDNDFTFIPNLAWMPWVGLNYTELEKNKKLLVIGESHYYDGKTPEELERNKKKFTENDQSTRDIISPLMLTDPWRNRTFENFHRTMFKTIDFDVFKFWHLLSFHNLIQRPMNYEITERPSDREFYDSWKVFVEVVKVLLPKYCIIIGVTASKSFDSAMKDLGIEFVPITEGEHFDSTYARTAELMIKDHNVKLIFIKHSSKFYSWSEWNKYLHDCIPDTMGWLNNEIMGS